jgi:hypothetical protein
MLSMILREARHYLVVPVVAANEPISNECEAGESRTLARFALFRSLNEDEIGRLEGECVWRRFEPQSPSTSADV